MLWGTRRDRVKSMMDVDDELDGRGSEETWIARNKDEDAAGERQGYVSSAADATEQGKPFFRLRY